MRKHVLVTLVILLLVSVVFSSSVLALTDAKLKAPKVSKAPTIDGKLDDEVWKDISPVLLANTNYQTKAKTKIESWVTWDDDNIYIAFKNYIPKKSVQATVKFDGGSGVWNDDENEIFLDPSIDGKGVWFQLIVNAIGTRYHAATGVKAPILKYPDWKAATQQYDDYWTLEVAIPFKMLGQNTPTAGTKWGINLCGHVTSAAGENATWSPIRGASFLAPKDFGEIEFVVK